MKALGQTQKFASVVCATLAFTLSGCGDRSTSPTPAPKTKSQETKSVESGVKRLRPGETAETEGNTIKFLKVLPSQSPEKGVVILIEVNGAEQSLEIGAFDTIYLDDTQFSVEGLPADGGDDLSNVRFCVGSDPLPPDVYSVKN